MKIVVSLSALVVAVQAQSDIPAFLAGLGPAPATDPRFADYQPPGEDDVRSPCPGLNTLANHGFLHRNGKNMTIPHLIEGGAAGLNMGADFMAVIGAVGLLSSPDPALGAFDLDNLDLHNFPIEHDVSLSRQDHFFGNWYDFNQTVWNGTLSYFNGETSTTTPTAAKARYHRVQVCTDTNPQCLYGPMQFILSSGETGLYVQTMSSPVTNSAEISYVRSLFEKQKLPSDLGWRPSAVPITLMSLGEYIVELYAANPDRAAEGMTVLQDSYADALVDLAGGANALRNLTNGISDFLDIPGL
ncbi:sterigmatocystin biosynthesis peroxidase stcC [Lecanosticta acicola]|uniref:Sterigmatocystin biosynthesis peroxidase stcC n=1 Tax=Lecanosticta acicola TaxID=111012 RepID=A0AAI9EBN5_9PEZI|nr:sterigmatocystin biosynthesis peroxidase stcC [Lecanosticta acicola]